MVEGEKKKQCWHSFFYFSNILKVERVQNYPPNVADGGRLSLVPVLRSDDELAWGGGGWGGVQPLSDICLRA